MKQMGDSVTAPHPAETYYPKQEQAAPQIDPRMYEGTGINFGNAGIAGNNLPDSIKKIMEGANTYTSIPKPDSGFEEFAKQKQAERLMLEESLKPQVNSDYVLVDKNVLKEMINEAVYSAIGKYKKVVEEATIKKTITTIIKEQKKKA